MRKWWRGRESRRELALKPLSEVFPPSLSIVFPPANIQGWSMCHTAWSGPEGHPGAWEDAKGAIPGAAFSPAREGSWGGGAKARKQAVIATCDCIWFVTAKAIIVFVELKREGRQMV